MSFPPPGRSRGSSVPPRYRWRRLPASLHPSLLFLLLGIGVLLVLAYQAQSAVRSHRATVQRVLTDYAGTAAWGYDRQLTMKGRGGELGILLEELFHPLHGSHPDSTRAVLPAVNSVSYPGGYTSTNLPADIGPIPFAMRFPLSGGMGEIEGVVPPGVPLERIREEVRKQVRRGALVRRSEGALGIGVAGAGYLLAFSRQLGVADTLLYVLPLDSVALAPFLRAVFSSGPLLPEPLVGEQPNARLLTLWIETHDGETLFRSGPLESADAASRREIAASVPGFTVGVALRDAATDRLIIGGPPASRLPLLLGLLLLAGSLLAVGLLQLRREQTLARLRSDFVASVSHELRTPLALQRVFLDMLQLGRVRSEGERRWAIRTIDREAVRLSHLVENVLQFSRAEQGHMRVTPQPADLAEVIRDAATAFSPLLQPTGATLELDLAPLTAPVDAAALRQVVLNLLENAVKYGPEGQTISVTLRLDHRDAVLTVDDEGPGIPPSERRVVFVPFRRGTSSVGTSVAGSGIGLAVVAEIVRLHGGTVSVEEAPSGGARLRVVVPGAEARSAHESDRAVLAPGSCTE